MIEPPTRSPERDAAILALLPLAGTQGWTFDSLRQAAGPDADLLFPGGASEMVETYADLADRRMVENTDLTNTRLSQRVRALVATRLRLAADEKPALRRAALVLAHPSHTATAARCAARTIDTIWYAAGDTSADFSWYTKRAILTAVLSATTLYWLQETTDEASALAFLDRRLAGVARLGKLKARLAA